ncbi:MAG: RNA-dependent DNA polymerase, partial [Thermoanaerobaculia bacterium]|nr:RNA-dependent DNA polymerase [Thermoanaerobaculia bacterium]
MKSFATRLEAIAAPEQLLEAWRRYRSGKRRRPAVAHFEVDAETRLLGISEAILGSSYQHGAYRLLEICDPKPRLIAVARVGDRVVHRSIHDALAPDFNRSFIADSYACLPDRGSHRAILRFLEHQRRFRYVMHLDIRAYFPSVDHEILLGLLAPRLRDRRVTALLEAILASGAELYRRPEVVAFYRGGERAGRPRGLPIGNLTSQWWGNLYLDGLDHFIKRELGVGEYLRYMDDLVLFADQPRQLRSWRRKVAEWLRENRHLELNLRKGHVRPTDVAASRISLPAHPR